MTFTKSLQTICVCFLLVMASCKNETTETKTSFIDGLTEVPESEWATYGGELEGVKFFGVNGVEISEEQKETYLSSGSTPKLYTDQDGKLKLGILSPPTEDEKKFVEEMMAEFRAQEAKLQDAIGNPAKTFDLIDYEGNRITSESLKGKVTVINFWFKECKPCIQEMPELNELVSTFKTNQKVQFLAFSLTGKDQLPSFFEKHNFDYRIIPDSQPYAAENGITGYPTNMIVDQQGNVAFLKTGFIPGIADQIKEEIEILL